VGILDQGRRATSRSIRLGNGEMWVMKPDGSRAHKLFQAEDNSALIGAEWSPRVLSLQIPGECIFPLTTA
jgi:hypothetical protein